MPVFDYKCNNCGEVFEELVFSSSAPDSDIKCPACGKNQAARLMSAPSIGGGGQPSAGNSSCGGSGFS